MPKARVLICDDNPAVQKSLSGYFEAENMEVVSAATGEEALERLRESTIDLLILDVMLPGMGGTEVCLEVRKASSIPILMLSAKGEEIDRIVGLEVGADDY
ncbi:MAG: response regulator, partial [Oscillospiraceae bacterium]